MKFERLYQIFNEDSQMTHALSMLLEGKDERKLESRKFLNSHISNLHKSNVDLSLKVEEEINNLNDAYCSIYLVAGYILGQAFNVSDPQAKKEIEFLKKELGKWDVIRYWPKDKKAASAPTKEEKAASSRQ